MFDYVLRYVVGSFPDFTCLPWAAQVNRFGTYRRDRMFFCPTLRMCSDSAEPLFNFHWMHTVNSSLQ